MLLASSSAPAMERVSLNNGFTMDCKHHTLVGERMRLYMSADDTSYQEIAAEEVAGIETLPDPPVAAAPVTSLPVKALAASGPTIAEMQTMLSKAGEAHNIDTELLAAVVKAESNFRVNAVSRAGAHGLMQLMPGTAREQGVQDMDRADQNIAGGTAYLDSLLKLYKDDVRLALAAYNAGPAAVARYHGVPPYRETRAYVARVIAEFNKRKAASLAAVVASR